MEKFQTELETAIKSLRIADHMTYVTYPLVKEQRLILKIFDEIYKSIINCINSILHYEHMYKRIRLYTNPKDNLNTFSTKVAKNYNLSNEQIKKIKEIIELNKRHKESAMEFVKKDKIVILSDSLGTQTLDLFVIKDYLILAKELILNTTKRIKNPI